MPTIVDALKQKYPDATGNTIADVIKNSGDGGGSEPGGDNVVIIQYDEYVYEQNLYEVALEISKSGKMPVIQRITATDQDGNIATAEWYYMVMHDGYSHCYFVSFDPSYAVTATKLGLHVLDAENTGSVHIYNMQISVTVIN